MLQGNHEAAVKVLLAVQQFEDSPTIRSDLAQVYARSGRWDEASRILRELEVEAGASEYSVRADAIAPVYAALGLKDEAFRWLDRAFEEMSPSLLWIRVWWNFDPLRSEPRYDELLRKIGLTE